MNPMGHILRLWRWRLLRHLHVAAVLAVISSLLAVSAPAPAQAATSVHIKSVEIFSDPSSATLCVGQTKTFTLRVWRQLEITTSAGGGSSSTTPRELAQEYNITNPTPDPGVGDMISAGAGKPHPKRTTRYDTKLLPRYTYKAKRVGTDVIEFTAQIPSAYPGDKDTATVRIPVEVVDCTYRVSAIYTLSASKLDQHRDFNGHMFKVSLIPGEGGSLSAGTILDWTEAIAEGCCTVWTDPGVLVTTGTITGSLSDAGLDLTLKFDPVSHQTCGAGGGWAGCLGDSWSFDTVKGTFPVASDWAVTQQLGDFTVTVEYHTDATGGPRP